MDAIASIKFNTGQCYRDETRLGQADGGSYSKLSVQANLEAALNHGALSNEDREGRHFKLVDGEWFGADI